MSKFYSSVKDVLEYTGVRPEDLGIKDFVPPDEEKTADEKLEEFIEARLVEIKNLIDVDRNRDYHSEVDSGRRDEIPPGIHHIALRIMKNLLGQAVVSRSTPIVRVDDFTIKMVEDQVFTKAIREDLRVYLAKPRFRFMRIGANK